MLRLGKQNIDIAPGEHDYTITDSYVLPVDVEVHGVQPHAHYRAKNVEGFATLPDGTVLRKAKLRGVPPVSVRLHVRCSLLTVGSGSESSWLMVEPFTYRKPAGSVTLMTPHPQCG